MLLWLLFYAIFGDYEVESGELATVMLLLMTLIFDVLRNSIENTKFS